jgi:hypothetical protein
VVAEKLLPLPPNGNIRYQLKTPYCDGTTHVIFEPLDFVAGGSPDACISLLDHTVSMGIGEVAGDNP